MKERFLRLVGPDSKVWRLLTPNGERFNSTARVWLRMILTVALGIVTVVVGLLLGFRSAREIVAGVLLGSGVSISTWAVMQLRQWDDHLRQDLRKVAEIYVLNQRLNEIGSALGVEPVDHVKLEEQLTHYESMIAHWSGLDEFRL